MWFLLFLLLLALLAGFAAIRLGYLPPPHATLLFRVRDGRIHLQKGRAKARVKSDIADILRGAGVSRGFIALTRNQRVSFSRSIPPSLHQRLRNVLLNQWA